MNPLDKSWDFLKAPLEGGENKKPLAERAAARRRKLNDREAQRIAAESQTGLNDPRFQNQNKTPMDRVSTTPSTGQMENPPVVWDPAAVEAARRRNQENR